MRSNLVKLAVAVAISMFASAAVAATAGDSPSKPLPPGQVVIEVEDLHCGSCAKKVARKLYAVQGVKNVSTDLKKDRVTITLTARQPVEPVTLWRAVERGGQKPVLLRHAAERIDPERLAALAGDAEPVIQ